MHLYCNGTNTADVTDITDTTDTNSPKVTSRGKVILGVAESDAHVVANYIIAIHLRMHGYEVVNLGPCTPVGELIDAYRANPDAIAIVIGSLNGHAYRDLRDIKPYLHSGEIGCPVLLGGNLSVGSNKSAGELQPFFELGIAEILDDMDDIVPYLETLEDVRRAA